MAINSVLTGHLHGECTLNRPLSPYDLTETHDFGPILRPFIVSRSSFDFSLSTAMFSMFILNSHRSYIATYSPSLNGQMFPQWHLY